MMSGTSRDPVILSALSDGRKLLRWLHHQSASCIVQSVASGANAVLLISSAIDSCPPSDV